MGRLSDTLRGLSVDVVETDGWETRTASGDRQGTLGVVLHWDAISSWPGPDYYTDRNRYGAVIYHAVVDRDGRCWLLSQRVAWHAGRGDPQVLDDLRAGRADRDAATSTMSGNPWLIGVAVNHRPPEVAPDVQVDALCRTVAALCIHYGLGAGQVIDHRRWTPRKPDIRSAGLPSLDEIRARVAALIDDQGDAMFVLRDDPDTRAKAWKIEWWKRQLLRLDPTLPFGPDNGDDWGAWSDTLEEAIRTHAAPATGVGIGPGEADRILAAVRCADTTGDWATLSARVDEHQSVLSRIVAGLRAAAGG